MIKYSMDKGELSQLECGGTVGEVTADLMCLIRLIDKGLGEQSQEASSLFRECLKRAILSEMMYKSDEEIHAEAMEILSERLTEVAMRSIMEGLNDEE